jgi:6-phosphogluconolactonase
MASAAGSLGKFFTLWMCFVLFIAITPLSYAKPRVTRRYIVYIGTYTGAKSKGIYAFRFDSTTGRLIPIGLAAETENPSFLVLHPNRKFLYAVNEVDQFAGKKNNGGLSAFSIDQTTGKLRLINQQSTGGGSPCHVITDSAGGAAFVANYSGGSIAVFPIRSDGSLGEASSFIQHTGSSVNKERQESPHAHGIYLDNTGRFAAAVDLGIDRVMLYRFDASKAALIPSEPPFAPVRPGAGPRHFAFHPNGRFAYVNNEMASTVTAFQWNARKGSLTESQTVSTLPSEFTGTNSTAELEVHPNGRFLYVSNRGHDSIAVYAIDGRTGKLTLVQHQSTDGKTPRGFEIDPTGRFLVAGNQNSDTIVVFRIAQRTGRLSPTGQSVDAGSPVCVKFLSVE